MELLLLLKLFNESTAGADASVEVQKLHNIKLLIAFLHTHYIMNLMNNLALNLLHAGRIQYHRETQRVGNDRP